MNSLRVYRFGASLFATTVVLALVLAQLAATQAAGDSTGDDLGRTADEQASVVEVFLADTDELDRLVATGADVDHDVRWADDGGIVASVVVTPNERAALQARGFRFGAVTYGPEDTVAAIAEREETIAAAIAENEEFLAASDDSLGALAVPDVKIIRADYYTSFGNQFLSVEAKWGQGQSATNSLVVQRDSGPGTAFGSGGQQTISRFVDAGVYLYHRGASQVSTRPDQVRITSPTGDVAIAKVNDWLPIDTDEVWGEFYVKDFVTSYMTPTDLYERIHQLAAEYPDISEIVELPYRTNGYRRKAQALLDPPGNRVTVDEPNPAAGHYSYAAASYGPAVPAAGVHGAFALADDGTALPNEGCSPFVDFPAGSIALVDRGTCTFVSKTQNAMAAGATAVVIVNNVGGNPTSPGGTFAGATIPTVMISQANGNLIKDNLPATGSLAPGVSVANNARVGVDSVAWGHEGGNDISIEVIHPSAASQPLTVSVVGSLIQVRLATNAAGNRTSTAAQVVAALNASAGHLVHAYTFRGNAGNGVAPPSLRQNLSDNLSAPDTVSRDPHPVYAIRIGKHRDGSTMGVLAYAQEHAREWVPPLVTIEAAERLLRNYAHDGRTKQLVNNLDIWIAPSINPDGSHYSFYDFASQRRTMMRYCPVTGSFDVLARNSWGVDTNRNYDQYSLWDGYSGASTSCTSDVYAGPSELSEPENRNVDWLAQQNIKFAMNLHSSGNYFMWSPGSYRTPGRISAPRPTLEEESFFWGASSRILTEIKRHRNLAVTPARTGPISDVLYSAAGNSGDMLWYKYGIYAWNFEVGTSFQPGWTSAHNETMEYANGLVEMMRVAYDFGKDNQRPESWLAVTESPTAGMVDVRFETSEPAAVFYTLDGSTPTYSSTLYASAGIREGGETLTVPAGHRIHWFSVDSAGNVERNYRPDGTGRNFNKADAVVPSD